MKFHPVQEKMSRYSFSAMFLFFFLVPVTSPGGLGEARAQAPKGTPAWFQIERGDDEKEILWVEEGGKIDFFRISGDRILEFRSGIMPAARFGQLMRNLRNAGVPASVSSAPGKPGRDACRLSGVAGGRLWAQDCHPDRAADPGISRLVGEFLGLSIGLQESRDYGSFLRLGRPEASRPRGLDIPGAGLPGKDPSGPQKEVARLIDQFLASPGKFWFSGDLSDWDLLDRLPADRAGRRWIADGEQWHPLLVYTYQPDPS